MRMQYGGLLLGLLVACSNDPGPTEPRQSSVGTGSGMIAGTVLGLTVGPDSVTIAIPARVTILWIGPLPTDSLAAPARRVDVPGPVAMGWIRPFGNDTTTDPLPPPPPPPPSQGCGRTGNAVAEIETDQAGRFQVGNLDEGIYDLHVEAVDAPAYGDSYTCAVGVRSGQTTDLVMYVGASTPQ